MSATAARHGSALIEYLGTVTAVGVLMLALVSVHEHRPQRHPPVDPVAHIRALVAPAPIPRVRRAPSATTTPRPRRRAPQRPRPIVIAPVWAVGW
jgi:hypothetical protein